MEQFIVCPWRLFQPSQAHLQGLSCPSLALELLGFVKGIIKVSPKKCLKALRHSSKEAQHINFGQTRSSCSSATFASNLETSFCTSSRTLSAKIAVSMAGSSSTEDGELSREACSQTSGVVRNWAVPPRSLKMKWNLLICQTSLHWIGHPLAKASKFIAPGAGSSLVKT